LNVSKAHDGRVTILYSPKYMFSKCFGRVAPRRDQQFPTATIHFDMSGICRDSFKKYLHENPRNCQHGFSIIQSRNEMNDPKIESQHTQPHIYDSALRLKHNQHQPTLPGKR
jgi:hypothetical protein